MKIKPGRKVFVQFGSEAPEGPYAVHSVCGAALAKEYIRQSLAQQGMVAASISLPEGTYYLIPECRYYQPCADYYTLIFHEKFVKLHYEKTNISCEKFLQQITGAVQQ
jgi:hypothetical protein